MRWPGIIVGVVKEHQDSAHSTEKAFMQLMYVPRMEINWHLLFAHKFIINY